MRFYLFLLSAFTSTCFIEAQIKIDVDSNLNVKTLRCSGMIKMFKQNSYVVKENFGEIKPGQEAEDYLSDIPNCSLFFSKAGYIIEKTEYPSGTVYSKILTTFDSVGTVLEKTYHERGSDQLSQNKYLYNSINKLSEISVFGDRQNLEKKIIYDYDGKGKLVRISEYGREGGLLSRESFLYDNLGNRIEHLYHTAYNEGFKKVFVYDANRRILEKTEYNRYGGFLGKLRYHYDANGNVTAESGYNSLNKLTVKRSYNYNSMHLEIVRTEFVANTDATRSIHSSYDSKGNLIKQVITTPTDLVTKTTKYDSKNNPIEITESVKSKLFGSSSKIISLQYTFDSVGNWIKRVWFESGVPKYLTVRSFEYY